ncbi:predicted protein [Uncinocarpus reesii 1704]|uniref:Uncharacterized protein n=1 Tax=Uncinocarpus reesii (strain UAMH 1704) TaxID=336963 RepID=C4K032_UNCRE|nr:uncharacterized protein UREG_07783 [Uncinocarpus reesii 1704]EEP82918.1 predicted protein [Uncinocarpus reesii 1704]
MEPFLPQPTIPGSDPLSPIPETSEPESSDRSTQTEPEVTAGQAALLERGTQTSYDLENRERAHVWHGRRMISISADYAVKFSLFSETPLIGVDHLDKSTVIMILAEKAVILASIPENPHARRLHDTIDEIRYLHDRHRSCFDRTRTVAWLIGPAYEGRPEWHRDLKMAVLRREMGLAPKRKFYEFVEYHDWVQTLDPVFLLDATTEEPVLVKINGTDVTEEWKQEWSESESPPQELVQQPKGLSQTYRYWVGKAC